MGRRFLILIVAIGIGFLVLFAFYKSDASTKSTSVSIWKQMKRRLLDDDVPQEKAKPTKQFDMTNI